MVGMELGIILADEMFKVHGGMFGNFRKVWMWHRFKGGAERLARDIVRWGDGCGSQRVTSRTRFGLDHRRLRAQSSTCTVAAAPLDRGSGEVIK